MSKQIENRVVKMEFDNARFEKNIKETSESIKNFNEQLKFKDTTKHFNNLEGSFDKVGKSGKRNFDAIQNAGKEAFDGIDKASKSSSKGLQGTLNGIKFDKLTSNIEKVKVKLSALNVAAATVISDITSKSLQSASKLKNNTIGQILTGGKTRALNIENAKFKIENLGKSWKALYKDMDYAVTGTAYGIDQAAAAAAQFSASGIEAGQGMKDALRGISGVASMTGSTFDEIANIFTAAAGKGKVQAEELSRISIRGVNAYAALAKELKVSEETVRDMASKGAIDFKTFARIMNKTFGESATKANDTFQGALSNTKAALSRVGEAFYTAYHENVRLVLLDTMPVINQFKNAIAPKNGDKLVKDSIIGVTSRAMDELRKRIVNFLKVIQKNGSWTKTLTNIGKAMDQSFSSAFTILDSFVAAIKTVSRVVKYFIEPIKNTFYEFFPAKDRLANFAAFIKTFTSLAEVFSKTIKNILMEKDQKGHWDPDTNALYSLLRMIFTILKSIGKLGGTIARDLIHLLDLLLTGLAPFGHYIFDFLEKVANKIIKLDSKIKESKKIAIIIDFIHRAMGKLETVLRKTSYAFKPFLDSIKELYRALKEKVRPELKKFKDFIDRALAPIFDKMDKAFRNTEEWVEAPARAIRDATANIKAKAIEIKDGSKDIQNSAKGAKNAVNAVGDKTFLQTVWSGISWFFERIGMGFERLKLIFKGNDEDEGLFSKIKKIFSKIGEILKIIWEKISPEIKKVANTLLDNSSSGLDAILRYLQTHDVIGILERISKIFLTGGLAKILWGFSKSNLMYNIDGIFGNLKKTFVAVYQGVDAIVKRKIQKGKIEQASDLVDSIAKLLKSLAISIALISASLIALSFIEPEKLKTGADALKTIVSMLAIIIGVVALFQKITDGSKNTRKTLSYLKKHIGIQSNRNIFESIAIFIGAIGAACLSIAGAIAILSHVPIDSINIGNTILSVLTSAIIGVIVALIAMTQIQNLRDFDPKTIPEIVESLSRLLKTIGKVMIKMAAIMLVLGTKMDLKAVIKGSVAIGAITLAIMGIMYATAEMQDTLLGYNTNKKLFKTKNKTTDDSESTAVTVIEQFTKLLSSIGDAFFKIGVVALALGRLTDGDSWWRGIGAIVTIGGVIVGIMAATRLISDTSIGTDKIFEKGKASKYGFKKFFKGAINYNHNESTEKTKSLAVTTLRDLTSFLQTLSNSFLKLGAICLILGKFMDNDSYFKGIGAITLFAALIAGIIYITRKIDGKKLKDVALTVAGISAGLVIMAAAFKLISNIQWSDLGKGFVALAGLATVLFVGSVIARASKLGDAFTQFGKGLMYCGVAMAAISAGIYLFIKSWKLIKDLKLDKEQLLAIVKTFVSIIPSVLAGVLSGMVDLILTFITDIVKSLTERMGEIVGVISKFMHELLKAIKSVIGEFDIKEVIEALVAVAVVFAMVWMLSKISENVKGALKGIAIMAVVLTALTVMFSLLIQGKKGMGEDVMQIGIGMVAVIGAVSTIAEVMTHISKIANGVTPGAILKAAGIILIAFALVGVMTATLTLVMNWIGEMMRDNGPNTVEEVKKNIKAVFDVLTEIATGFGNLIGSFVGNMFGKILSELGKGLSDFMQNAKYFIDESKKIKKSDLDGIRELTSVIFSLLGGAIFNSAAKYIDDPSRIIKALLVGGGSVFGLATKLFDSIGGKSEEESSPLVKLAKELAAAAVYFEKFGNTINKISDPSKMKDTSKYIGESIKYLQENLPWQVEAFWGFFSNKQVSLADFGKRMYDFLGTDENPAFIAFAEKLETLEITDEMVQKCKYIGESIFNLQSSLPWQDTKFSAFISGFGSGIDYQNKHQTSLADFGKGMREFSDEFSKFATNMEDVKDSDFDKATKIADVINIISSGLGTEKTALKYNAWDGLSYFSEHSSSITNFAKDLSSASGDLVSFINTIGYSSIPDNLKPIDTVVDIIKKFFTITNGETIHEGGLAELLFGKDKKVTLSQMATELKTAIPAFEDLSKSLTSGKIKAVTEAQKQAIVSVIDTVTSIIHGLPGKDEEWEGVIEKGQENLRGIRDFLLGYSTITWERVGSGQEKQEVVNWTDGMIDLAVGMSEKLSKLKYINTNQLSWYTTVLNDAFKLLKDINTDDLKNVIKKDSEIPVDQVSAWIEGLGDSVIHVCKNAAAIGEYAKNKRLTKEDLSIFKDFTGAVTEMFSAFHKMTSEGVLRSDGNGSYADVVTKAISPMNTLIDRFAELNSKIDATKVTAVTTYFKAIINEYKSIKDRDLSAIKTVNQAFANLTRDALNIALQSTGLLGESRNPNDIIAKAKKTVQAKDLARYYNYILLAALDHVKTELNAAEPSLNGTKIKKTYLIGATIIGILASTIDKKNNALVRAIADSVKEAYNKIALKTRKPGTKGADSNGNFWQLGIYIANGLEKGIREGRSAVITAVADMVTQAEDEARNRLEIHSPSKVFFGIGKRVPEGFGDGISQSLHLVEDAVSRMTNAAITLPKSAEAKYAGNVRSVLTAAANKAVDRVDKGFTSNNALTPVISPVISDSGKSVAFVGDVKMKGISLSSSAQKDLDTVASSLAFKHEQKIAVDNGDVVKAITGMDKRFMQLESAISKMQINLDGDKLVGGISSRMNTSLGNARYLSERGV